MEAMLILLILGFFLGWGLGIAGYVRAGGLQRRVVALEAALRAGGVPLAEAAPAPPSPWARPEEPAPDRPEAMPPEPEPVADPLPAPARRRPGLEELLTLRLGVWLGAGALLLAGVFLVRTAVEEGWLGPEARCGLAALLGLALVLGAEWLRRRPAAERPGLPWPDQAPAALAAGGVAILFGAAYATGPMYGLVPPLLGIALLALAALGGIALALVFGPVVAAIGIAGAYVTPALVETQDPSLPSLFLYLLAVTAAALVVLRQVGAAWLGWCATIAAAGWVVAGGMIAASPGELWFPALFAPAAAALHVVLLPGAALESGLGRRLAFLPFAVLAAAGLVLVPGASGLAPAAGVLLFSPIALARAAREPRLVLLPWVAALAGLLLLLGWTIPAWLPPNEAVTIDGVVQALLPIHPWPPEALVPFLGCAALLAALHAAVGIWQERRAPHPLAWAALPAAVPVLVLLVAYARVRGFALDARWALAALALAAGLVGLAGLAQREAAPQRAGAHAAGAMAALALGAAMVLSDQWLTLAVALFLPPLAWVEGRSGLTPLRHVALAVATLVLARLLLNWNIADYAFGSTPLANGLLAAYGVPAASFALAAWMFRRRRDDLLVAVLEAGALVFTTALVVLEIRHALTGGEPMRAAGWPFREAALQLTALALLAAVTRWLDGRAGGRPVLAWGWRLLQGLVVAIGAGLVVANPALEAGVALSPWPILNELALAYAVPAVLAALAVRAAGPRWFGKLLALYALAAGFTWVTLEVRHHFHPAEMSLDLEPIGGSELYAYSGAWLAFGAALLALGIRQGVPALRLAALAAIGLTILKAFLVDMAELEGLWRVLSFLGLGLALIALGAVYRRFVVVTPAPAPPA
ncbi:DUF2339 domain-containing protein [Paeniroseomonas aquatica]|uniref:DUF2339 domain-containing protein n=1 Tax=Paeniroseomonas aquatica TaxID=373043 RepID=A0ABT8A9H6_9PROT|nr:DUF2339 domain-containing protein [Paeniroseomonas aquatica]MDN3566355.1 DUF2339 domain-containing protein [Paeniroseomonas aquatica]